MQQALIPLVIFAVQEAIKYFPKLQAEIVAILSKKDASTQDWIDLQMKYTRQSYESIVTETGLKPTA